MQRQTLLTLVLAAMVLAPVASAYAPNANSSPAGEPADVTTPTPAVTGEASSTSESGSDTASAPASGGVQPEDGNYTQLYIADSYLNDRVKPGETTTFNVTVGNGDDAEVELDPHVVVPQFSGRPVESDWVTVDDGDTTLGVDEEETFAVTVDVPESAELGGYQAQLAFTDETISYAGEPERPVHAATLSVDVYREPTIDVDHPSYYNTLIEAGDSYTYEIEIENSGDEAASLDPEIGTDGTVTVQGSETSVDRSWFTIDAPAEVEAGDTVTAEVTVNPPESADIGRYDEQIDLGIEDPARPNRNSHWQEVRLNFRVWQQPDEPFVHEFEVSNETQDLALDLSAETPRQSSSDEPASFDVTFVAPDGTELDGDRASVTDQGYVDLSADSPRPDGQGAYSAQSASKTFEYEVEDPQSGSWTVEISPENVMNFNYEVVRDETAD